MAKHLGKYISSIHRHGQSFLNPLLDKYNLGGGHKYHIFLMNLYDNNGITLDKLSKNVRLDKVTTTRAIRKLEMEGYIYRMVSKDDKRAHKLYTTKRAEAIRADLENIFDAWNEVMLGNLSQNQRNQLFKLIEHVESNILNHFKDQNDINV